MTRARKMALLSCLFLAALPARAGTQAAVPAPGTSAGPGAPVPSPGAEKEALAILGRLAAPMPTAGQAPWKTIICGPSAWQRLAAKDPALSQRGVKTSFVKPGQATGAEGRTFSPGHDDALFYKSAAVAGLAKDFAAGKARSADQKERDAFYAVSPASFELKGKPVTMVNAGGETLLVYADKDLLWLDLPAAAQVKAAPAPAAAGGAKAAAAPGPTVESIYTAAALRDPFTVAALGGISNKPFTPEDFSIHNLTLRGVMKDRAADYALFTDNSFGVTFILRHGKLYDAKGKPVDGITGSMNLKLKTAFLKTPESDVQTFKLGEESKD